MGRRVHRSIMATMTAETVENIFNAFDDGSGKLDVSEMTEMVRQLKGFDDSHEINVAQMMKNWDKNHDGFISLEEFQTTLEQYLKLHPEGAELIKSAALKKAAAKGS